MLTSLLGITHKSISHLIEMPFMAAHIGYVKHGVSAAHRNSAHFFFIFLLHFKECSTLMFFIKMLLITVQ